LLKISGSGEERNLWIFASYIASVDNVEADFESRRLEPKTEYALAQFAFCKIISIFGNPEIDLFATRTNKIYFVKNIFRGKKILVQLVLMHSLSAGKNIISMPFLHSQLFYS